MKFDKKKDMISAEADMTPMIDMTFQLIAFFMVLINFVESDANQAINLPRSELAKPPDAPFPSQLTLQVDSDGKVLALGDRLDVKDGLPAYLRREVSVLGAQNKSIKDTTIVIRADVNAKTGVVQEVIKACQDQKFEKFALRAKQKVAGTE